jgi:hypothetical protein
VLASSKRVLTFKVTLIEEKIYKKHFFYVSVMSIQLCNMNKIGYFVKYVLKYFSLFYFSKSCGVNWFLASMEGPLHLIWLVDKSKVEPVKETGPTHVACVTRVQAWRVHIQLLREDAAAFVEISTDLFKMYFFFYGEIK